VEEKKLRKQEQFIIWPAYFDINKSREEGRRVAKNLAVISPRVAES
jgi:signal recognition particle subunit SRP19